MTLVPLTTNHFFNPMTPVLSEEKRSSAWTLLFPPLLNYLSSFPSIVFGWQEHRSEIDARAGTFQAFEMFGHQLLANNHYESPQVQEKLTDMNKARDDLEK